MSHGIGERPWRSSGQPTPFITFCQVIEKQQWQINRHNDKKTEKRMNAEHGEENVQVKAHAYVHR